MLGSVIERLKVSASAPASSDSFFFSMRVLAVAPKAEKKASAVSAAEPIAKPLPIAAVVLPTASRLSMRYRTSGGSSAISATPPALSATGP